MTGSMIEGLRAQVDEDERAALAPLNVNARSAARHGGPLPPHWIYDAPQIRDPSEPRLVVVKFVHAREAAHITRHDPARVLREVAFKRTILKAHSSVLSQRIDGAICDKCIACEADLTSAGYPCPPLRRLAAVYADRPGYQEAWRP